MPSLRLIRARLKAGGSFRDVGQLFLDWSIERDFRPRPKTSDLPDYLRERLATVAAEVWRDGHRNGILAGQDQRDLLAIERDKRETLLVEALAMADGLENERNRLLEEIESIRSNRVPVDRAVTTAFWKRATKELVGLMGDDELGPEEIMALVSAETEAEALGLIRQVWCPSLLVDKLRRANLIEEPKKGLFRRRSGHVVEAVSNPRPVDLTLPDVPPPDERPTLPPRGTLRDLARRMRDQDEWEPDIGDRTAEG
ncbi:DNA-binding protein [Lichenihabitans psoromatis]|uniref:DNA-binding protein n=1 Tax=Lichenihabitans psoromatis TaxID=2528642 RepID=UPI001FE0049F|nr:DNA-binding protein [Lichenihabitans psoromatis]